MTQGCDLSLGPLPVEPVPGLYPRRVKPLLDRTTAWIALATLSPLMLLIGLAVGLSSQGGVFFRQLRIGYLGRPFQIVKFRTMIAGARGMGTGLRVLANDPRVTPLGRFLRATSLDELPQIWNVARGEMSWIGPRPTVPEQVRQYDDFQRERLRMRPGITGLAQVSGRKSISWDDRIQLDIRYMREISLRADLRILAATARILILAKDPPAQADYWNDGGRGQAHGEMTQRNAPRKRETKADTQRDGD